MIDHDGLIIIHQYLKHHAGVIISSNPHHRPVCGLYHINMVILSALC